MSAQHGDGDATGRQEPDRVPWRPVMIVLGAFLTATAIGLASVTCFTQTPLRVPAVPSAAPQARAALFGDDRAAEELMESQRRILESYGWVDRENGIVRIPIERAMQIVVEREVPVENSDDPETP